MRRAATFLLCSALCLAQNPPHPGGGGAPSGPAGGDLSGTYPNPGVNPLSLLKGGWTSWVDPRQCDAVHMFCAAGTIATTTGTMVQGSNQLTVASAVGWTPAMGISVAGGIAGGSELGGEDNPAVSVLSIAGNVFTLSANCTRVGGVTGVTVNHEDSVALNAAKATGLNVHGSCGGYNVTSRSIGQDIIVLDTPLQFIGDGACTTIYKRSISGAIIRISADNFGVGTEGGRVSGWTITQGSGFTPSDGPAIYMASARGAGFYVNSWHVDSNLIIGTCGGIYTGTGVNVDWVSNNRIYSVPVGCVASGGIKVNTPSPGGDINFVGNQLAGTSTGINLTNADTNSWTGNKVNGGQVLISPAADGSVFRQRFVDTSVEGQGGSPTCGWQFSTHTSDQIEIIGGGTGLNFTNGICASAATTGLRVVGSHFYALGGYGLSLGGGSTASITANEFASTSGAIDIFGSSSATINGNTARSGSGWFIHTNAVANNISVGANTTTLANSIGVGTICRNCYSDATFTVATLPACNAGTSKSLTTVSDATTPSYNGALVGGGAVQVPAYCDGAAWLSH